MIESSAVRELLRHHTVVLDTPNAEERIRQYVGVEAFDGDASRCDASIRFEAPNRIHIGATKMETGLVYGPCDDVISPLIKMIRSLPVIPAIEDADAPLQPLWHEDLARALAAIVERGDAPAKTLDVAGIEITTLNEIIERLCGIVGRKPARVPLPRMQLVEKTRVLEGINALVTDLKLEPTPLSDGLRMLAHALPEQTPEEGVGALEHKRFAARIEGSRMRAASLMTALRNSFADIVPLDFTPEPHSRTHVERGATLTLKMPMRGNVQVRVEVMEPQRLTLSTIEGHPLAGAVQFTTMDDAGLVEFAIDTYTRSANLFDWIATKTVGRVLQDQNWKRVVQRVIDLSGGSSPEGVKTRAEKLEGDAAREIEKRLRAAIQARLRKESAEDAAQR